MDKHTLRVLEFNKILEMAGAFAVSSPGKDLVLKIKPIGDIKGIRDRINLISEGRHLLAEGKHPGIEHFEELTPLFQRLRPADSVLAPSELTDFLPLFSTAINIKGLLRDEPSLPMLSEIASHLRTHASLKRKIESSIDREGKIADGASPELSAIREGLGHLEKRIRAGLEGLLRRQDLKPHIQEFYITGRNNRWVIPVKRDSKGHVKGVVHDISNSGETLFIEPYETQALGNELESLRAEEKVEEFRVLRRLSAMLRDALTEIVEDYHTVLRIDCISALAAFSDMMGMTPPEINERGYIRILKGRHPLLWQALRRIGREESLQPLDFELGSDYSCIVITGSNTGGKTVALKTVGVLQIMALCGLHLPAESGTTLPMLGRVLADIGDEQSIEQNLSTFSAHIGRISEILARSDRETLVIIDELGTGTDPEEGGPLSCAILRELRRRGALTAVSTHLGLLKAFAHTEPGMINGAMQMEEEISDGLPAYRPTYRLLIGEMGQSHAFEIAGRLGLPPELIREARGLMKESGARVETLLSELMRKREELDLMLAETARLRQELTGLRASLREEIKRIRAERKEILSGTLREAEGILLKARREARDVIRQLKQSEMRRAGEVLKGLDRGLAEVRQKQERYAAEETPGLEEVREGQTVCIRSLGVNGIVRSVNRKTGRCRIVVRGREIEVPAGELAEPVTEPADEAASTVRTIRSMPGTDDITEGISGKLNLIGQRVDPALSVLERYLNDASMAGLGSVKIIHGIGTGRLSSAVREYLKGHPLVREFRKGEEDEGGEAVTVVYL